LFWHGIVSDSTPPEHDSKDPSVAIFAAQVEFLVENYTPISIWEFLEMLEGERPPAAYSKPPILLGFDDGLRSVITHALPVLTRLRVPAVFFVVGEVLTDPRFLPWFVEMKHIIRRAVHRRIVWRGVALDLSLREDRGRARRLTLTAVRACRSDAERQRVLEELASLLGVHRPLPHEVDDDLRFVTSEDLAHLDRSCGLTIASHAMTHRHLADLDHKDQRYELRESDAVLRGYGTAYCPVLAYPAGSFNAVTVALAREIYRAAFAVFLGASYRNRHAYPRVGLGRHTVQDVRRALSPEQLKWVIPLKRLLHVTGLRRMEG
jgi:peptidoglycan/xylan/chitin deacetylase (PgdA/CDA1 family)